MLAPHFYLSPNRNYPYTDCIPRFPSTHGQLVTCAVHPQVGYFWLCLPHVSYSLPICLSVNFSNRWVPIITLPKGFHLVLKVKVRKMMSNGLKRFPCTLKGGKILPLYKYFQSRQLLFVLAVLQRDTASIQNHR